METASRKSFSSEDILLSPFGDDFPCAMATATRVVSAQLKTQTRAVAKMTSCDGAQKPTENRLRSPAHCCSISSQTACSYLGQAACHVHRHKVGCVAQRALSNRQDCRVCARLTKPPPFVQYVVLSPFLQNSQMLLRVAVPLHGHRCRARDVNCTMTTLAFCAALLCAMSRVAASGAPITTVEVNLRDAGTPLEHFWKASAGSGHAKVSHAHHCPLSTDPVSSSGQWQSHPTRHNCLTSVWSLHSCMHCLRCGRQVCTTELRTHQW